MTHLQSIEEMAGIDMLCSDKTGTLTQNKLTLETPVVFGADDPQEMILAGALASNLENPDAIDQAVIAGLRSRRDCIPMPRRNSCPSIRCTNGLKRPDSGRGNFQGQQGRAPGHHRDVRELETSRKVRKRWTN